MPSIKVYPPNQLPDRGISETQFNIWIEELEVYLSQEPDYRIFLDGEAYAQWLSQENNPDRLVGVKGEDVVVGRTLAQNTAQLKIRQRQLRTVLSIVGKCVSLGHYDAVMRNSTSMQWIYDMLRNDYDIQKKGIHFFNLLDLKYDATKLTPVAFYNQYRTLITSNLAKNGDVIKYKDGFVLQQDEKVSPMLEDIILLDVIREIDARLPAHIRTFYTHKMSKTDKLMDFKNDILNNIPKFLQELDKDEHLNAVRASDIDPSMAAFRQNNFTRNQNKSGGAFKKSPQGNQFQGKTNFYCRLCHKCEMPRAIYTGHNIGDAKCTQLSSQDRDKLRHSSRMSSMMVQDESSEDKILAAAFGYNMDLAEQNEDQPEQVLPISVTNLSPIADEICRPNDAKLSYIKPEPTQLLTVFYDVANKDAIHIELDSGATVNYVRESVVLKYRFKIYPNGQLSTLGDGVTKLGSIGEIDVTFFRNDWKVRFRAIVVKDLQSPLLGGTVFMVDNEIEQNLFKKVIHIHDRKITVQQTDPMSLLPIQSISSDQSLSEDCSSITQTKIAATPMWKPITVNCKTIKVILPGHDITQVVKVPNDTVVAIEPWENNKNPDWPEPQLCTVKDNSITIRNNSPEPVILGKDVKLFRVRPTAEADEPNEENPFYNWKQPNLHKISAVTMPCLDEIKFGDKVDNEARELLENAHKTYADVFDKDLTNGYNDFYGKHRCQLNWASQERPLARKV